MRGILTSIAWCYLILVVSSEPNATLSSLTHQNLQARGSKHGLPYIRLPKTHLAIDRTVSSKLKFDSELPFNKRSIIKDHLDKPTTFWAAAHYTNILVRRNPSGGSRSSRGERTGSLSASAHGASSSAQSNNQAVMRNRSPSPSSPRNRAVGMRRDTSRSPSPGRNSAVDMRRDGSRSPSPGWNEVLGMLSGPDLSLEPGLEGTLGMFRSRSPSPGACRISGISCAPMPQQRTRRAAVGAYLAGPATSILGTDYRTHEHTRVPDGINYTRYLDNPFNAIASASTESSGVGVLSSRGRSASVIVNTGTGGTAVVKLQGAQGTDYAHFTPGQGGTRVVHGSEGRHAKVKAAFTGNVNVSVKGSNE